MLFKNQKIRLIMELRQLGITSIKVLSAIEKIPREIFVPKPIVNRSYENTALPLELGQTISQPSVVAFMTQSLNLKKGERVLEIGTGSGYQTAILSLLCRRVYTIERYRKLMFFAEQRFNYLSLQNIVTRIDDGTKGWKEQSPIANIIVTAAASEVPAVLADQLKENGTMIIPIGDQFGEQHIVKITKKKKSFKEKRLIPVRFVPLVSEKGK